MTGARVYRALLALVCIALLCLVWPALALAQDDASNRDRGILQAFLEDNLSGAGREVRIEGFQGALSGRATIDELTIADETGVWLTLRDAVLDWSRAALLSGRLDVNELSAAELIVTRAPQAGPTPPSATAPGGFTLPDLPVSVRIDELALARVELGEALFGQQAVVQLEGNAALAGGEGNADLRLARIDGPEGRLELVGGYANETRNLALSLVVEEGENGIAATLLDLPGRPALLLEVAGDDPIDDFRADIRMATDGTERLTGAVTLLTTRDENDPDLPPTRRIAADLGGDIAPVFAPQYRAFFGPEIDLDLRAASLPDGRRVLENIHLRARSLDLTGNGALAADGWPEQITLTGRIADPDGSAVRMPVGDGGTQVGRAELSLGYDRAGGDTWRLTADARDVVQGETQIGTLALRAGGTLVEPRGTTPGAVDGTLRVDIAALDLPDPALARAVGRDLRGQMAFDWSRGGPLTITGLDLSGDDYGLTGGTRLRQPSDDTLDLHAGLDLTLAARDLARFADIAGLPLAGQAALQIVGDIAPVAGELDLRFSGTTRDLAIGQDMVDPLLRGDGRLALRLRRDTTGTTLDGLDIATDHARITGAAQLQDQAGRFDIDARLVETALVIDGLRGPSTLAASGQDTGDGWDLTANATLPGDGRANWQGRLTGLDEAPRLAGRAEATFGSLAPYSILAQRRLGGGITARADVDAMLDTLSGRIDLSATTRSLSVGLPLADQLLRGTGELQARARRDAQGRISIDRVRITTPALTMTADGEMTASGQSLSAALRLTDGSVLAPELAGPVRADGTARRSDGDWRVGVTGTAAGSATLAASGTIAPDFSRAALSMTGRAPLALANARLRPRSLSGIAAYDLRLNGPLALSSLSGRISTSDARLALPDLAMALENIDTQVTLGNGRAQVDLGAAVSNGGRIGVTGGIGLTPPLVSDLRVALQQVTLHEPRLFETTANGTVTVSGPLAGGARIAGVIDLGPAELRVPASSGATYAALPGLKHVNEPPEVRRVRQWAGLIEQPGAGTGGAAGPAFPVDLLIRAPSRIFVRGRGLDAELGGELRLLGTTAALVPQGRFELVRGRLDILGQRLTLDEGLLTLQGSFDPFIRFAATTQADDTAITLAIEGLASAPELRLSSSPELPEDEVLSRLLFGRDLSEISPLQAVRLANALAILSGRGGIDVAARLRGSLALDDLDVTTDSEGNVEARAGKYLSENIYSDVTVNGEGETEINLNLQLSPSFTVRGQLRSDGDTGIGVYFERDY